MICRYQSGNIWKELRSLQSKILRQLFVLAAGFLAQSTEDNEKRVLRSVDFETASPETQEGLCKAWKRNWGNSFILEPLL